MASERVHLILDTSGWGDGMKRAAAVAEQMHIDWTLRQATWEPHDWGDL